MTQLKHFSFTLDELVILRDALGDAKQRLTPPKEATERRVKNYRQCMALLETIRDACNTIK